MSQRLSLQQLGDEERRPAFGADIMHDHQVRMVQRAGEAGLLLEALEPLAVEDGSVGDDFERHLATQPGIARPVHLAHPPRPDGGQHLVGTDSRSSCQLHAPTSVVATPTQTVIFAESEKARNRASGSVRSRGSARCSSGGDPLEGPWPAAPATMIDSARAIPTAVITESI